MIKLRWELDMNVLSWLDYSQIVTDTYSISICIFGA